MVLFIEADSGLPEASLSIGPMIVANPISCIANQVGTPALLLSSCSSFEKALHSGPISSILSVITNPQFPQNISPLELSVTIGPFPHRGHLSLNRVMSFTKVVHQKNCQNIASSINVLFLYIKLFLLDTDSRQRFEIFTTMI